MTETDIKHELRDLTNAIREQNAILRAMVEANHEQTRALTSLESHERNGNQRGASPRREATESIADHRDLAADERDERERRRRVGPGGKTIDEHAEEMADGEGGDT